MKVTIPNLNGTKENYMAVLNSIIGNKRGSFIDLACCFAPHTPLFGFKERTYIDMLPRTLDFPNEQPHFTQADILTYQTDKHYDVAFCLDGIEHLTIPDGYKLLEKMEAISDKQILFTPFTDLFGMAQDSDHNPESHRSLWRPDMVHGYAAIVFPHYHQVWNGGAWFFWKCDNIEEDFARVIRELGQYNWFKL